MGRKTSIIPKAAAAKIIFNAGAKRVAAPAAEALVDVLIDRAGEIAARAVRIAKHSGRKTVKDTDIKIAVK